jgi:hypothetical protein
MVIDSYHWRAAYALCWLGQRKMQEKKSCGGKGLLEILWMHRELINSNKTSLQNPFFTFVVHPIKHHGQRHKQNSRNGNVESNLTRYNLSRTFVLHSRDERKLALFLTKLWKVHLSSIHETKESWRYFWLNFEKYICPPFTRRKKVDAIFWLNFEKYICPPFTRRKKVDAIFWLNFEKYICPPFTRRKKVDAIFD